MGLRVRVTFSKSGAVKCHSAPATTLQSARSPVFRDLSIRAAGRGISRGIEYAFMVEIDDTGRRAHRLRAEQQVEKRIALKVVEQESQQALRSKSGVGANEPAARVLAFAVEMIGDGMTRRHPVLQRGVYAAGGHRGDHARGVAHQKHALCSGRLDDSSAWNHSSTHGNGPLVPKVEQWCDFF